MVWEILAFQQLHIVESSLPSTYTVFTVPLVPIQLRLMVNKVFLFLKWVAAFFSKCVFLCLWSQLNADGYHMVKTDQTKKSMSCRLVKSECTSPHLPLSSCELRWGCLDVYSHYFLGPDSRRFYLTVVVIEAIPPVPPGHSTHYIFFQNISDLSTFSFAYLKKSLLW